MRNFCIILIFAAIISNTNAFAANTHTLEDFLVALAKVESNNSPNAVGDNGRAIGIFQIWESYYQDAKAFDPSLKTTTYSDVKNVITAHRVVLAYFERYEPRALEVKNFEVLARLHNLGPSWRKKSSLADNYWSKVRRELDRSKRF